MLYQILKPIVTVAVHIFYKRVVIVNREALNRGGATMIVANHTNAFLDALVVSMFVKRKVYSLARGDVFKNELVANVLRRLCIIPIYRKEEGVIEMAKNEATFKRCIELLEERQNITMYPEGNCVTEKRLRSLRKGAARIALNAEAKNDFSLDAKVLPVGINFSAAKKFRSDLIIFVGEPIAVKDYEVRYKTDAVKAINQLTVDLAVEMRKLLVNVEHGFDNLYEDVLGIYKPSLLKVFGVKEGNLQQEHELNVKVASAIRYFKMHCEHEMQLFQERLHRHVSAIAQLQIPVKVFAREFGKPTSPFELAAKTNLLLLFLPIHIIGLFLNYLPYFLAYNIANEKVKQIHFHASVNFAIGMFGWLIWFLLQIICIFLLANSVWLTLLFVLLIPASGLFSIAYYSRLRNITAQWRMLNFRRSARAKLLMQEHSSILNELGKATKKYLESIPQ